MMRLPEIIITDDAQVDIALAALDSLCHIRQQLLEGKRTLPYTFTWYTLDIGPLEIEDSEELNTLIDEVYWSIEAYGHTKQLIAQASTLQTAKFPNADETPTLPSIPKPGALPNEKNLIYGLEPDEFLLVVLASSFTVFTVFIYQLLRHWK